MNLRDLADTLDARAEQLPFPSPRGERMQTLANAARDLDRLRDYRRYMDAYLFHFPLGDINTEAEAVRDSVREALNLAADLRAWSYREVV